VTKDSNKDSKKDTTVGTDDDVDVDVSDSVQEGVELNSDGTITIKLSDRTIELRPPIFGAFRAIKRATYAENKRMSDMAKKVEAQIKTAREKAISEDGSFSIVDQQMMLESLVDETMDGTASVIRLIVEGDDEHAGLGDGKLPEDQDEWPAWLITNGDLVGQMLMHWKNVPLARG
jgi:protein-disulfide isomerase-like protein with CxxC motif